MVGKYSNPPTPFNRLLIKRRSIGCVLAFMAQRQADAAPSDQRDSQSLHDPGPANAHLRGTLLLSAKQQGSFLVTRHLLSSPPLVLIPSDRRICMRRRRNQSRLIDRKSVV